MNGNNVRVKIITPTGLFIDEDIKIMTVKTSEGYIGIQHGKSPFVASIAISELHLGAPIDKIAAIAGGILYATPDGATIITDAIEYKDKIDLVRAEREKSEAEKKLKQQLSDSEQMNAELSLRKALNRLSIRGK